VSRYRGDMTTTRSDRPVYSASTPLCPNDGGRNSWPTRRTTQISTTAVRGLTCPPNLELLRVPHCVP